MTEHLNRVLTREIQAVLDILRSMHGTVKEGGGVFVIRVPEEIRIQWSVAEGDTRSCFFYSLEIKVPEDWVQDLGFDTLLSSSEIYEEDRTVWAFRDGRCVGIGQMYTYQIVWTHAALTR